MISMWASASVMLLILASLSQAPRRPAWEVVRSADGDFAFSMPVKPGSGPPGTSGTMAAGEDLAYSCEVRGCSYEIRRTRLSQPVRSGQVIAELARMKKQYLEPDDRLVKDTKLVVDGVPGDELTYTVSASQGSAAVTRRIRYFLKDLYRYELKVASPPGQPLPADATRFLSSLTFEALVKSHYASLLAKRSTPAAPSSRLASKAASKPNDRPRSPIPKLEVADSTPEDALRTFLLALAAHDQEILRAITLPDKDFDWLLKGRPATPQVVAEMSMKLGKTSFRRLAAGDRVTMPGNRSGVIQPSDVREGRVVLLPRGAPFPTRLENRDGHWKVFALPFIVLSKTSEVNARKGSKPRDAVHP
jgi:hypothetical protein